MADDALLEIDGLVTEFRTERGTFRAVDGVSFRMRAGETLGIVGESGSGKSVTALSIMRLIGHPAGRTTAGTVRYAGRDLLALSDDKMRRIRGNRISMIYQEPMTSLNPVHTVGAQIGEVLTQHKGMNSPQARAAAIDLLRAVGIALPERRVDAFPHELSGGMRQRVMIAMALACDPEILLADEPTTALDVTIQAQILDLIRRLKCERGTAVLLITHDLGVVAQTCDRVMVMYAGRVVETGDVFSIFENPLHPYTEGLLASIPDIDATRDELRAIEGVVPNLLDPPPGCRFAPRCAYAVDKCRNVDPALTVLAEDRAAACHFAAERSRA
jgi:oligopeptide/dipeptide ABC transporter ATP-binding protein